MSGKTIRQYAIRKRYSVEPVVLFRKGNEIRGDISDQIVRAGDTMIVYGLWERINELKASIDFVVPGPLGSQEKIPAKAWVALFCFATSIALTLAGFPVSLSFFSGAVAMVLTRTITLQEMYEAIDWKVVFLIAGLIPLGLAMQKTGAAVFLAEKVFSLVSGKHTILLTITVALLATIFSLVISNVGAMVVLAPIVIEIARIGNADPRPLVLLAAICTSNSFILPTHQVNAFVMSAGGYRNADYLKTGAGLTLLFLILVTAYFSIVSV